MKWEEGTLSLWSARKRVETIGNHALRLQRWKVIRIWQHSLQKSPDACLNRIRRALAPVD
jgi:very-short-patch-repair endonuclease